jgi:hypothetical protein
MVLVFRQNCTRGSLGIGRQLASFVDWIQVVILCKGRLIQLASTIHRVDASVWGGQASLPHRDRDGSLWQGCSCARGNLEKGTWTVECRFMNLAARSAGRIASFWCAPVNGRARNVRNAARGSWRRSFRPLRRVGIRLIRCRPALASHHLVAVVR